MSLDFCRSALPWLIGWCACGSSEPSARELLFDFENGVDGWTVASGDVEAFASHRPAAVHRHGSGFIGTGETAAGHDPARHGVLLSPKFRIDHDYLVFRAGGRAASKRCRVELVSTKSGKALRSATVPDTVRMQTHVFDVIGLRDRKVRLRLVDEPGETPCSIHFDWVRQVDG